VATNFVSPHGDRATIENIWNDGGFFATGFMGMASGFQIAFFAYNGVELVGAQQGKAMLLQHRGGDCIPARLGLRGEVGAEAADTNSRLLWAGASPSTSTIWPGLARSYCR
jgi:hypothetical protein